MYVAFWVFPRFLGLLALLTGRTGLEKNNFIHSHAHARVRVYVVHTVVHTQYARVHVVKLYCPLIFFNLVHELPRGTKQKNDLCRLCVVLSHLAVFVCNGREKSL